MLKRKTQQSRVNLKDNRFLFFFSPPVLFVYAAVPLDSGLNRFACEIVFFSSSTAISALATEEKDMHGEDKERFGVVSKEKRQLLDLTG